MFNFFKYVPILFLTLFINCVFNFEGKLLNNYSSIVPLSNTILIIPVTEQFKITSVFEKHISEMLSKNNIKFVKYDLSDFTLNTDPLKRFADSLNMPTILRVGIKSISNYRGAEEIDAYGIIYDSKSLIPIWKCDFSVGTAFGDFVTRNYFGKKLAKALAQCLQKDGFMKISKVN